MLCKRFSLCPEHPATPGQRSGNSEVLHLQERFLLGAGKGQPSINSPETSEAGKNTGQNLEVSSSTLVSILAGG